MSWVDWVCGVLSRVPGFSSPKAFEVVERRLEVDLWVEDLTLLELTVSIVLNYSPDQEEDRVGDRHRQETRYYYEEGEPLSVCWEASHLISSIISPNDS